MAPVESAGGFVSVDVELSGKCELCVRGVIVLMAEDVLKRRLGGEVLYVVINGFGEIPIGSEGGVGETLVVLESLVHACDEAEVIRCIDKGVEDLGIAVVGEMV